MRAPKPETGHMETEALLAVMNGDDKRLSDLLSDMRTEEIQEFYQRVGKLSAALLERLPRRRDYQPRHQRSTVPEGYGFHDDSPVRRASDSG